MNTRDKNNRDGAAPIRPAVQESETFARTPDSVAGQTVYWVGIGLAVAHIYFNTLSTLPEMWVASIHFAGFGFMCALLYPAVKRGPAGLKPLVYTLDVCIALTVIAGAVYLILFKQNLYERGQNFDAYDWIFAGLTVLAALELTRRAMGWFIPALIIVAMTYVFWWGSAVGGIFSFPGLSLETVLYRAYFSTEGMFGQIANISWTFVFMFILFGAFLVKSGAGDFIINLSLALAGRFVGGPGFVAVLGSGLLGSVSGSAVGNTVSTGVITIPLMKKAGFAPRFAAGTEAAASTGGQLMPPVMGAGAFVMSNFTGVSYLEIVAVSVFPAILYFMTVGFFVRIEARRRGTQAHMDDAVSIKQVLRDGWHLTIPFAVLITLLVEGFTPTYAAGYAILSVIVSSWFGAKAYRMGPRQVLDALAQGARNMTSTAVLLVSIGLVVMVVGTTGIGNTFSLMVTSWAGDSLLITLILVALASLVLGMGLPVTAAYIVLATLSAPAIQGLMVDALLVEQLVSGTVPMQAGAMLAALMPEQAAPLLAGQGLAPDAAKTLLATIDPALKGLFVDQAVPAAMITATLLSAHLIIFWLSQDSNVTPPVCLAAFAAAAIAGTRPMATGFAAWKIAKGLYIIPLLIAYTPFIGGSAYEVMVIFGTGLFGLYAAAGALEGYLENRLNSLLRLICAGLAAILLWPNDTLAFDIAAILVLAVLVWWNRTASP